MFTPEENEPDAILIEFARSLPATIKDVVVPRCCIALDLHQGRPGQDFFATFCSILQTKSPLDRPYRVAMLCGIMELALEHAPGDKELYEKLAKENPEVETFAVMALQAPLKDKHWQASREAFGELRLGPLSAPVLRIWQNYLMVKHPIRIPSFEELKGSKD